jgi:hypothetical protein
MESTTPDASVAPVVFIDGSCHLLTTVLWLSGFPDGRATVASRPSARERGALSGGAGDTTESGPGWASTRTSNGNVHTVIGRCCGLLAISRHLPSFLSSVYVCLYLWRLHLRHGIRLHPFVVSLEAICEIGLICRFLPRLPCATRKTIEITIDPVNGVPVGIALLLRSLSLCVCHSQLHSCTTSSLFIVMRVSQLASLLPDTCVLSPPAQEHLNVSRFRP